MRGDLSNNIRAAYQDRGSAAHPSFTRVEREAWPDGARWIWNHLSGIRLAHVAHGTL